MGKKVTNKIFVDYNYSENSTIPAPTVEAEVTIEIYRYMIVKTTPKKQIGDNEDIYYVITAVCLDNNHNDSNPLVITDTLPAGLKYAKDSAWVRINRESTENQFVENDAEAEYKIEVSTVVNEGGISTDSLTFTIKNVDANGMVTIRFSAKPIDGQVVANNNLTNKTSITETTPQITIESNEVENQMENSYGVSKISVIKESVPQSVICGQDMYYQFTIKNESYIPVSGITLTDDFKIANDPHFEIGDKIYVNGVEIQVNQEQEGEEEPSNNIRAEYVDGQLTISNLTIDPATQEESGIKPAEVIIKVYGKMLCS